MTIPLTFHAASLRWRAWRTTSALADVGQTHEPFDDAAGALAEEAEVVILDHDAEDADELAMQFEVIIYNIESGGRADGRDLAALKRLQPMLSKIVSPVAAAA